VELARRYAGDVLSQAMAHADHAGRASLEADDVRLAIRTKSAFSPGPPRHEVQ
jgi:transcription initiation factor TFIID subunit 9B